MISRRVFVGAAAGAAAGASSGNPLPPGAALRVKPVLLYHLYRRREQDSWRSTGGLQSRADVEAEARRIDGELRALASRADFPVEFQPLALVSDAAGAAALRGSDFDSPLIYAAGGPGCGTTTAAAQGCALPLEQATACGKPVLVFLRRNSGPIYYYYKGANFRFLRRSTDDIQEKNVAVDDFVVDEYDDVLWRLRALYGLKNTKGTKSLAIGGMEPISAAGGKKGPDYARKVWGFEIIEAPAEELARRIAAALADQRRVKEAGLQTDALLAEPNITLATDRKFVFNTFVAAGVVRGMMQEAGASSVGVARCMASLMRVLDTPPCLMLSLLNDEGLVAFCHNDFMQTPPGVLLRWISGKPVLLANSYFPYRGTWTIAHCSSPRKMDGRVTEPAKIVTHFESDYGAATKVDYRKGQVITVIVPNPSCTRCTGCRATIAGTPSRPDCRSQIDMAVAVDHRRMVKEIQGFHAISCYGDYLRECGYALAKAGLEWVNLNDAQSA